MARRPSFFIALTFAGGIVIRNVLAVPDWLFLAVLLSALASARLFRNYGSKGTSVALLLAVFAAGAIRLSLEDFVEPGHLTRWAETNEQIVLVGKVISEPESRRRTVRFQIETQMIAAHGIWQHATGRALTYVRSGAVPEITERVLLSGELRLPDDARNPGGFDYRHFLRAQGVSAVFYCDSVRWRSAAVDSRSISHLASTARTWIADRLTEVADGQRLALLRGLLLGERSHLDERIIESFAQTGMIHLLAVSGLHVGFIILILAIVLELLQVPRKWRWLLIIVGLFFYAHLTGLKPPVIRASIMAAIILLGQAFERRTDIYNSLGVAAVIILLWQPPQLFQLGFQLSFAAVLGIALLYRPIFHHMHRLVPVRQPLVRWAMALLAVSLAAQLGTLPFSVSTFGRIPLLALCGNLVAIPAAFVIVATGALSCLFAPFAIFMQQAYGAVSESTAGALIAFTQWLAGLPFAFIDKAFLHPLLLIAYLLAVIAVTQRRRRGLLIAGALTSLNVFIWNQALQNHQNLRIIFFDVGQGDAALLEFPGNRNWLIDAGPWDGYSDAGERVIAPYLHRQGIKRLNGIIITHPHADHLGGLLTLMAEVEIDTVYDCGIEIDSWLEDYNEHVIDSLRISSRSLHAGEALYPASGALISVLHPLSAVKTYENINDASVVLRLIFGDRSFLFTGDAEEMSEHRMLARPQMLDSDLLKVGHHGSNTSSTLSFLHAVTPEIAVVSAGRRNKFNHPHPAIVSRYKSLAIPLFRTDRNGAVVIETDGKQIWRIR